ncbi:MAG TPA: hypothetical protein VLT36_13800, partial [Candidatus Dormibacteraeota bacterium]|nr:hypothetical protein [Candidatus Dormibacteraeota bacterium]
MKWNLKLNGKLASLFLCSSFLPLIAQAAVSVSLSPATTSNTYSGVINLQVTGLAGGDSVVVQKYVDLNTNGIVDAPDMLWQQFKLTDGQATTFGGVTNLSVPGDLDSTSGQITAQLNLQSDFSQSIVGKYLFVVSSPVGHFTALTNVFTITNASFAQQITGNVINNGTNVPFASVLLFQPSGDGMNPKGGAVANSTGGFTIKAPAGTYTLVPFGSNFVANLSVAPNVTLNNGQTLVTNLVNTMLTATQSISGKVVDASNSSLGVPGLLVPAQGSSGLLAIATTDTNGNFNARVVGNQWKVDMDGSELNTLSYLRPQNNVRVDTTTGSVANVSIALPKATAMFYGTVKDSGGTPLPHVQLFSQDEGSFLYESDGLYSDQNGKYFAGTLAGLWSIGVSGDGNPDFANYAFTSSTNSTLSGGQALRYDFVGLLATNHITGHVQYNGNPVTGVSVFAYATIGPNTFQVQMDT